MKPDAVLILGAIMVLLGIYVLWRAHRNKHNRINIEDLLVDGSLEPPRVTLAKFVGLGAWMASTWWMTYIVTANKFDSAAFTAYLAVWGAVKVAGDFTKNKEPEHPKSDYKEVDK